MFAANSIWFTLEQKEKSMKVCNEIFAVTDYAYTAIPTYLCGQVGFVLAGKNEVSCYCSLVHIVYLPFHVIMVVILQLLKCNNSMYFIKSHFNLLNVVVIFLTLFSSVRSGWIIIGSLFYRKLTSRLPSGHWVLRKKNTFLWSITTVMFTKLHLFCHGLRKRWRNSETTKLQLLQITILLQVL